MKKQFLVLLLLIATFCCKLHSENIIALSDSAKVSLLTNSPSDGAVYSLFGHTAVRIQDKPQNIDLVFNYGVFDFNSPNFMARFVKGETDYMVVGYDFKYYLSEYQMKEVSVWEQNLNLTKEEKQNICNALFINSLPENRVYRYNFFFDNCSTRPRDIIEQNVEGTIRYSETDRTQTLRDLLHECLINEPWTKFGIDIVIGSGADRLATEREKMFLPLYLKDAYDEAVIINDSTKTLIESESYILDFRSNRKLDFDFSTTSYLTTPLFVGFYLLIICIILSTLNFKLKYLFTGKLFDTILFLIYGLAGCIVAFLMFFSEHPCVDANWNLIWLNPIQLIVTFLFFSKKLSKYVYYYHFINFASLSLFLMCWTLIPQQFEVAFVPFVLTMLCRSGINIVVNRKKKKL